MTKHIYENTQSANKEIAYFSLGWDVKNCIPGFISNMRNGNITRSLLDAHGISKENIENQEWGLITDKLKYNVQYDKIMDQNPTNEEAEVARSVKTNLKTLKYQEIEALIKHASCITELQIKLYCPSLVKK